MEVDIVVPQLGESITEATVSSWLKAEGDTVAEGDVLVELETDKVMVEVPAQSAGVLGQQMKGEGETVAVGDVLGKISSDGAGKPAAKESKPEPAQEEAPQQEQADEAPKGNGGEQPAQSGGGASGVAYQERATSTSQAFEAGAPARSEAGPDAGSMSPAVRRLAAEHSIDVTQVTGTGRGGRVTKEDMVNYIQSGQAQQQPPASAPAKEAPPAQQPPPAQAPQAQGEEVEERVPMSRLRQRIAQRLVEAQQTAAILTTFNEVDMTEVMALRNRYKESFREKYGASLGFMSFFTKACIEALRAYPAVNGEIRGEEIVYKHFYHIGVAVGTERGLVVPVVRHADRLRFIEIEMEIARLAQKARDNKLTMDDLTGGTFSISNGGIYGSMMSTPILNPPQSGILGMHNIVERPMVVDGEVKVRPMMYIALSYDHRLIDGREAVQFLVRVKQCIEDPSRMLLEI